jgi:uncharacterized membrane protein
VRQRSKPPIWLAAILWTIVTVLALTGMTSGIFRALAVMDRWDYVALTRRVAKFFPTRTPEELATDVRFSEQRWADHPIVMLAHAVPGFVFMILGPFQFIAQIRSQHIRLHRWSGRVFLAAGAFVGVSAIVMPLRFPLIAGEAELAIILPFAVFLLFALAQAYLYIRRRQIAAHREWMIRAFAIGLGIAAIRPADGLLTYFTHLDLHDHFAIAMWTSLCGAAFVAEMWIRYTRRNIGVKVIAS